MDWEAAEQPEDGFDYFSSVVGMNFPSSALYPFCRGSFDPLTAKEKEVVEAFCPLRADGRERFYVVATFGDGEAELRGKTFGDRAPSSAERSQRADRSAELHAQRT